MKFSASKAGLLRACRYAFRDGTPCVDERGRAAINGDRFHKAIATYIETGVRPVETGRPLKWLEDRMDHATAWVDKNRRPEWRVEVAYAYRAATGEARILGSNLGREYAAAGLMDDEIAGSADLAWLAGDTIVIADHKTGRAVTDAVWAQLEILCLMAAKAHGARHACARVLHATDYGIVEYERHFDELQMWGAAEQLKMDLAEVGESWPQVSPACDACFCPARAGCDLYQLTKKEERHDAA